MANPTGTVSITGVAAQDQTLVAGNNIADPNGIGTIAYQWLRGDGYGSFSPITAATSASYTLTQDDIGYPITVTASYTDQQGTPETFTSAATAAVLHVNHLPTGTITIAGTALQDQTLTATASLADTDGLGVITDQWQRDDGNGGWIAIAGATNATYTLAQADVGHTIGVVASYVDGFGTSESVASGVTASVQHVNHPPTGSVQITGIAAEDQQLTVGNTLADPDGLGVVTYQWQRDDGHGGWNAIPGATATSYLLAQADISHLIRAVASYTDALGTAETVASTPTATIVHVNHPPTGTVTIAGDTTKHQTLTAISTLSDPDGIGTLTYQWQRADAQSQWTSIGGATAATYTLAQADVNNPIRVIVGYLDAFNTSESVASNVTANVSNVADPPTGSVTISGTLAIGHLLLAANTLVDADGLGPITYQWQRADGSGGWNSIAGANHALYTVVWNDAGLPLRVVAQYTDLLGSPESIPSTATANVVNADGSAADPLFNTDYYLATNPDVAASGVDPYQQYLTTGWRQGRDPTPLFSTSYYLNHNPDVAASGVNPLVQFETIGWRQGRDPSPYFSVNDYLAANPAVKAAGIDPLLQFAITGQAAGQAAITPAGPADPGVDAAYYYAQHPDIAAAGLDASLSYNTTGWKLGYNPNAWFDTKYYLANNPDVAAAGVDPLTHYEQFGWKEGRDPSLVFSDSKYLSTYADIAAAGINPLLHYVLNGQSEGRSAFLTGGTAPADPLVTAAYYDPQLGATLIPTGPAAEQQAASNYATSGWQNRLNPDPWFDTSYYLTHNPDVAASGIDPLQQFETIGWTQGRNPSAAFSVSDYLAAYPTVKAAGIDPLLEFLTNGQAAGRVTFAVPAAPADPLVDATYYYAHAPDVKAAGIDASAHYTSYGWLEHRNPSAFFDTNYYLAQNPDVRAAGVDPLLHYELYGWREGRDPSLAFSDSKYLSTYSDIAAANVNPLLHYVDYGQSEGRSAFLTGGTAPADPLVSAAYYDPQLGATIVPTGVAAEQQAASSYHSTGWLQGLKPSAFFDPAYYLAHNPDVAAAHVDPLLHYELFGWTEGRDPSAQFSTSKYLAAYIDIRNANVDPLMHYVVYGQAEGRTSFAV